MAVRAIKRPRPSGQDTRSFKIRPQAGIKAAREKSEREIVASQAAFAKQERLG